MFEVGWTEMLVIAVVMIVVVGPKDLPKMLRTFGKTTSKLRAMAGDFQKQFNEALREAELDDVKKSVEDLKSLNPANEIRKHINPFEKAAAEIRDGINKAANPTVGKVGKPDTPAVAEPAEPLKTGAAAMPDAVAEAPAAPAAAPAKVASMRPAARPSVSTAATPAAPEAPAAVPAATARAGKKSAGKAVAPKAAAPKASAGKRAAKTAAPKGAAEKPVAKAAAAKVAARKPTAAAKKKTGSAS